MAHSDLSDNGALSSAGFTYKTDQVRSAGSFQAHCRVQCRHPWNFELEAPPAEAPYGEPEPYGMCCMPFYVRRPFVLEQETI